MKTKIKLTQMLLLLELLPLLLLLPGFFFLLEPPSLLRISSKVTSSLLKEYARNFPCLDFEFALR